MGEAAEYVVFGTGEEDVSDYSWLENHFWASRRGRHPAFRSEVAKAVRREHGEKLNAQMAEAEDWETSNKPQAVAMRKNRRKSAMKSKIELRNIAASVSDELVTVRCLYNNGAKRYTFLCPVDLAQKIEKDDWVTVSTKNNTYEVLQVANVDEDCDIDDLHLTYQWVVGKVDTSRLDTLRKWHEAVGNDLHKQQRKQARKVMLEQMNVDGVAPLALTAGVSGDVIDAEDTGE